MAWVPTVIGVLLVLLASAFWIARRRGSVDRAIEIIDRRLLSAEGAIRAELLRRRGDCYAIQGSLWAASTDYETCLELQPDRAEHWEKLAEIYRKLGRLEAAERCARRVLELKGSACPNAGPRGS